MVFVDRYRAAGLYGNPFAAPQAHDDTPPHFVDRGLGGAPSPGSKTLIQIIGDSGYGKSTQLARWRAAVPGPYHYIPRAPYRGRWAPPPVEALVYGDEVDRMPAVLRARWFRSLAHRGATVVVGTHEDLVAPARRAGLEVVTHRLKPLTVGELRDFLDGTLRASGDPLVQFSDEDIYEIAERSGGIPREACVHAHALLAASVAEYAATMR